MTTGIHTQNLLRRSHIQGMTEENRERLKQMVLATLPIDDHGAISFTAWLNAVRGAV